MLGALVCWLLLQSATGPVESDLASAARALEAEKYADAAPILEKVVAADPQNFRARFNLAFAYTQLNRDAEAIEQYRKVVESQPDLLPARVNLGQVLLRQKQYAEAAPHLSIAAEKKPQDLRAQLFLAAALLGAGENDRAAGAYRKALELDPRSAAAHLGLGRSLARAGAVDQAREHFLQAAQFDPEYRDALPEFGDLLEQKQRPKEALAVYLEFLKSKPDAAAVRERAGVLLLQQQQYEQAAEQLEPVVKQSPTPANQAALAQAYTMLKQPAKALPLLRAAASAQPDSPDVRFRLATVLIEAGDFAGAAHEFMAVTQRQKTNMDAWNGLGLAFYRMGDLSNAMKALDQARQLGPEPAGNHYLRGIILDQAHQYPAALESYQKFLGAAGGRYPDDEFKARQRVRIITNLLNKRR